MSYTYFHNISNKTFDQMQFEYSWKDMQICFSLDLMIMMNKKRLS